MSADTEAIRGSLDALNRVFVTNARDWAANRTEAWLWGVVVGWDNDGGSEALDRLAAKFGWNRAAVAQLRAERAGFAQIEQLLTEVTVLRAENARLREHEERTEKVLDIVERSLNQVSAKRAEAETAVVALREQVADALALCTETRPDSVIGTSDTDRLKAVRERLAMPVGGGRDEIQPAFVTVNPADLAGMVAIGQVRNRDISLDLQDDEEGDGRG